VHQSRAVHVGHLEIEHERVGPVLSESRERLPAVTDRVHLIAFLSKGIADDAADTEVVTCTRASWR
jgi:hypothetical protein